MQAAFAHAFILLVAVAMARFGWFMAQDPERAVSPSHLRNRTSFWKATGDMKLIGRLGFTVGGGLGTVLFLVLISIDLSQSHS